MLDRSWAFVPQRTRPCTIRYYYRLNALVMGDSLQFSRYSIQLQGFFSFPMAKRPKSIGLGASRKRYHVGDLLHSVGALNPGASSFNNKTPIRLVLRRYALMIFPRAVINLHNFYLGTATIYRGAKIRLITGDPTAGFGDVRYTGPRANKQGMKPRMRFVQGCSSISSVSFIDQ